MSRKALFTSNLIPPLLQATREAGELIMRYYRTGPDVARKADASPVTIADKAADRHIVAALKALTPDIPVVSEEGEQPDVSGAERFWLVDPLDGTKSFIRATGYFTVNIGLIEHGIPVMGIVYEPVSASMYWSGPEGVFRNNAPIAVRVAPPGKKIAFVSHSHIDRATRDYLATQDIGEEIPCASSIKFCFIAEGVGDLYPRFGPTMEWDTAAGHAILLAAGGKVATPEGAPFIYGKKGFLNGSFLASGK